MKIKINVTQLDIIRAKKQREIRGYEVCQNCPVARAVRRHEGFKHIDIGYETISSQQAEFKEIKLSKEVSRFIIRFDERRKVTPFSFEIETNKQPTTSGIRENETTHI